MAPLISLTRPSPAHCRVSMPQCAIWLLAAFPGLVLTSLYHDSIWTRAAVGRRYHRRPFQQQMIKTSPFLEFQIDRSLFRMKGGIWEEFYHFCDHQLIKTDEIVGHRESWMPLADNSSRRLRCSDVAASTRISSFVLINNDLLD